MWGAILYLTRASMPGVAIRRRFARLLDLPTRKSSLPPATPPRAAQVASIDDDIVCRKVSIVQQLGQRFEQGIIEAHGERALVDHPRPARGDEHLGIGTLMIDPPRADTERARPALRLPRARPRWFRPRDIMAKSVCRSTAGRFFINGTTSASSISLRYNSCVLSTSRGPV